MIIVTSSHSSISILKKKYSSISLKNTLVELRIDYLISIDFKSIRAFIKRYPTLITLRSVNEGGAKRLSRKARKEMLRNLMSLRPDYIDLEYKTDQKYIEELRAISPKTKILLSNHHLKIMPRRIDTLLKKMKEVKAWKYKIVGKGKTIFDGFKMLELSKEHNDTIAISMGEEPQVSRILNPLIGQPFTYASLDKKQTASGQFTYKELIDTYHYFSLNKKTKLLGVVGDPIAQSPGYLVYNPLFQKLKINALYYSFKVSKRNLRKFIKYAQSFNLLGLSITIPHKEKAIRFQTHKDTYLRKVGSLNTLKFSKTQVQGCNTDGLGCTKLLEKHTKLKNKTVLIVGAGGTAKGIGYFLSKAGCKIVIVNRNAHRAKSLARKIKGQWFPLKDIRKIQNKDYDILVHTTSVGTKEKNISLVPKKVIFPSKVVLDVVFNQTQLLSWAAQKKCIALSGKDFYLAQGLEQLRFWFKKLNKQTYKLMEKYFNESAKNKAFAAPRES